MTFKISTLRLENNESKFLFGSCVALLIFKVYVRYVWIDKLEVQFSLNSLKHESSLITDHGRLYLRPGAVPRHFWEQLLVLEFPQRIEFVLVTISIVCAHR